MAESLRRSTRAAKKLRKQDFLYGEDILNGEDLSCRQLSDDVIATSPKGNKSKV